MAQHLKMQEVSLTTRNARIMNKIDRMFKSENESAKQLLLTSKRRSSNVMQQIFSTNLQVDKTKFKREFVKVMNRHTKSESESVCLVLQVNGHISEFVKQNKLLI